MYAGSDFDSADTAESEVFAFDYTALLPVHDYLVMSSWDLFPVVGDDADPELHLVGSAMIPSPKMSAQRISGLLPGVVYTATCTAQTASGSTLVQWTRIVCER